MSVCVWSSSNGTLLSTPEDVYNYLIDENILGDVSYSSIYISSAPVPAGSYKKTIQSKIKRLQKPEWLVFVDDHPYANWEHGCRFVFIDPSDGSSTIHYGRLPPENWCDLVCVQGLAFSDGQNRKSSNRQSSRVKQSEHLWAVIISGGLSSELNHPRYWNDCSAFYTTLVQEYGYPDDQIIVAISDGLNPLPDQSDGSNSDPDLDDDGDNDIMYSCTKSNVITIFNDLAQILTPLDTLVIFATDHGSGQYSIPNQPTSLNLWNGEKIWDDEFAGLLETVSCREIIITLEPCYSGGFIDNIMTMNSSVPRVISTAANDREYSYAMPPDYEYDAFVFHWTAAVRGMDAYSQPVDADSNQDGQITLDEAFIYAEGMDNEQEHPQYTEFPPGYGSRLTLSGSLPTSEGFLILDRSFYNCSDTVTMMVDDLDLEQQSMVTVLIRSDTEPGGENVDLISMGGAHFEGSIFTTLGIPVPDNKIQISNGDTITIEYLDLDYGGSGPLLLTYQATIDCVPPTITRIKVSDVSDRSVGITWDTNEPATTAVLYGPSLPPLLFSEDKQTCQQHHISLSNLESCMDYNYAISSTDRALNTTTDNNSGFYYNFQTWTGADFLNEPMDDEPGWYYEGLWQWGKPLGQKGDPLIGYTNEYVIGYNLNGPYTNKMEQEYVTTPPFSCVNHFQVIFSFWQWLGIDNAYFDTAGIDVSVDGGEQWQNIWQHTGPLIVPTEWQKMIYDISPWVDNKRQVQLRWSMGPTNKNRTSAGWNIDDVRVFSISPCDSPHLVLDNYLVDDSAGNGNGETNVDELLTLRVKLINKGLDASGIYFTLMTETPHVRIVSNSSDYPDLDRGQSGENIDPFVFIIDPSDEIPQHILFITEWTSFEDNGAYGFNIPVHHHDLTIKNVTVIDHNGDDDGIIDPGETVQLYFNVYNTGDGTADNVIGTIEELTTSYLTLIDNQADFGTILPGETVGNQYPFTIYADASIPEDTKVTIDLGFQSNSITSHDQYELKITSSNLPVFNHILILTEPCINSETYFSQALAQLDYDYVRVLDDQSFYSELFSPIPWDLIIVDEYNSELSPGTIDILTSYVLNGGRCIINYWAWDEELAALFGAEYHDYYWYPKRIYRWFDDHPLFNYPYKVPDLFVTLDPCYIDGAYLTAGMGAYSVGGYSSQPEPEQHAIIIGNQDRTLLFGGILGLYGDDRDKDEVPDGLELAKNAIVFIGAPQPYQVPVLHPNGFFLLTLIMSIFFIQLKRNVL